MGYSPGVAESRTRLSKEAQHRVKINGIFFDENYFQNKNSGVALFSDLLHVWIIEDSWRLLSACVLGGSIEATCGHFFRQLWISSGRTPGCDRWQFLLVSRSALNGSPAHT